MPDNNIYKISSEALLKAYPKFNENKDFYLNRISHVTEKFKQTFGENNSIRIFSAPGRTEIGGNHTDHQHGCVVAAAIDLDILAAASANNTNKIRILSEGYELQEINIENLSPVESEINTSPALIRGICAAISKKGYEIKGFDVYAISNVLKGSGLSSSAAFEVLIGTIINNMFCNQEINAIEIAQIGQYAENVYFGKPSGLMDQMACSVGNIVAIDFNDTNNPIVEKIDFDFSKSGHSLCIIDSGADHADLTDEYSAIPAEMKAVAAFFGKEYLRQVDTDEFMDSIAEIRKKTGDRAVLRAIHFFNENTRAQKEAKLLKENKFDEFLNTAKESGYSSYMYLQNVSVCNAVKHQEVGYCLAVCSNILKDKGSFRVHGGGFAGTIQAFVPNEMVDEFIKSIEKYVGVGSCHILSIRPAGGIEFTCK